MHETIGPYQVIRFLGRGGMGEVLLAYDPRLDRQVAIKRIRAEKEDDAQRRARFRREARLAAGLRHPAIVQVHDLVIEAGIEHIILEYVPGTTVRHVLDEQGRLPPAEGLTVARTVAEGLAYAHQQGVIHRDLKTENVLLTPEGEARITDFGIARRRIATPGDDSLTREGAVLGTCRAMSPEQLRGQRLDHRSDLFSFGVMLYEVFAGRSPFLTGTEAETLTRILHHTQPPAMEEAPELPSALSDLIDQLLEKDPYKRLDDTEEVAQRLGTLAEEATRDQEATRELGTTLAAGELRPASLVALKETAETPTPEANTPKRAVASPVTESSALGPPRRRSGIAAGLVAIVTVMALVLLFVLRGARPEPLYVAVLIPEAQGDEIEDSVELAFTLRHALLRTLTSLETLSPKATAEVDAISGPPSAVARALAADEVVASRFACRGEDCTLEIERVSADGTVLFSTQAPFPRREPLRTAQAVTVALREGFPKHRVRSGMSELQVSRESYATFLEMSQALGARPEAEELDVMMERSTALQRDSPGFAEAYVLEARLALRRFAETREPELIERADDRVTRAQELAPEDPRPLFLRVTLEITAGRLGQASATLERLEALLPGDLRLIDRRAHLLEQQGELTAALDLLDSAARRRPSWRRLYNHARMASRLGQEAAARQSLLHLLERSPDNRRGLSLLAGLEMRQGRFAAAVELLEPLVDRFPRSNNLSNLGLCYLYLDRLADAERVLGEALAAAPKNPFFALNLADVQRLQDRVDAADELYRRVVAQVEKDPSAKSWQLLSVQAQALAHLGQYPEAITLAQQVLREAPEEGWAAFETALVYTLAGEVHSALVNARRARELGIETPWFDLPWFDPLRAEPRFQELVAP